MSTDLIVNADALKSSMYRICSLALRYSVRNLRSSGGGLLFVLLGPHTYLVKL